MEPEYGEFAHTRVEVKRTNWNKSITALKAFPNPLGSIEIICPLVIDQVPEKAHHWSLFMDSCRLRGPKAALALLPETLKDAYATTLDHAKDILWDPTKLWSAWPDIVDKSGLLDFET